MCAAWAFAGDKLSMELTLPVGTTATVHTPQAVGGSDLQSVRETSLGPGEDLMAGGLVTAEGVSAVEVTTAAVITTVSGGIGRGGFYRFEALYA